MKILFAGGKGGAKKSSLACTLAVDLTNRGFKVLLADADAGQKTSAEWALRRKEYDHQPPIECQIFRSLRDVSTIAATGEYDYIIGDLKPRELADIRELALEGDLVIIPSGASLADLNPATISAKAIDGPKVVVALSGVGSEYEELFSKAYLIEHAVEHLQHTVPEGKSYRRMHDRGLCYIENPYGYRAAHAKEVMDEIFNLIAEVAQEAGNDDSWKIRRSA